MRSTFVALGAVALVAAVCYTAISLLGHVAVDQPQPVDWSTSFRHAAVVQPDSQAEIAVSTTAATSATAKSTNVERWVVLLTMECSRRFIVNGAIDQRLARRSSANLK